MNAAFFGPFCAFMSSVTWALGSSGYSKIAREHSAFSVNFARGLVALPLFLVVALGTAIYESGSITGAFHAFEALQSRHIFWLILSMIASYGFGDSVFLISSRAIGIPAALTIASSYPIITASLGAFVHHEWLSVSQTVGLLFMVGGVAAVILCTPASGAAPQVEDAVVATSSSDTQQKAGTRKNVGKTTGVGLAFLSSLCWATNSYCVTEGGQGITAAVGNSVRMATALVVCLIFGKIFYPKSRTLLPKGVFKTWMWLFVFEAFGGSYFFLYGLSHSPLAIGATLASLAPVLSVPVALALGLETFSWKRTAGVVTVVAGLFLLVGGLN